jgi:hypothetical protein
MVVVVIAHTATPAKAAVVVFSGNCGAANIDAL